VGNRVEVVDEVAFGRARLVEQLGVEVLELDPVPRLVRHATTVAVLPPLVAAGPMVVSSHWRPSGGEPPMLRAVRRRLPARVTNITLLVVLALAFATGAGAVASGSARARWVVLAHGVAGALVVVLAPAKTRVARAGLRLRRPTRYASLVLAALTVATLVVGVLHSTG